MELDARLLDIAMQLVAVGAFYGAVRVELAWIKKTLDRLENQITERKTKR